MRTSGLMIAFIIVAPGCAGSRAAHAPSDARSMLFELERRSHEQWLERDRTALDSLMASSFHLVVMNGEIETRDMILGERSAAAGPSPLSVRSLEPEPELLILHGDAAIVIGVLHLDASVRGRPLPRRMRTMSVFSRSGSGSGWQLIARSITPILTAGGPPPG